MISQAPAPRHAAHLDARAAVPPGVPDTRRHTWWLFAITFLIYLSTAAGVLEFGDDWSMLQVTSSIADHGGIDIPATAYGAARGTDGRSYSKYGLGQSVLALPFYVVGTRLADWTGNAAAAGGVIKQATALTYVLTMLGMMATALAVALLFRCARALGFGTRSSAITALGLGLGTFAWYWALTFMAEPPSMLVLLAAFYAQVRDADRPSPAWLALAGTALAFAILLRMGSAIVLPGFGLWLLWEVWRTSTSVRSAALRLAAWSVPVFAGLAAVAAYNYIRFGSVADTGYGATAEHLGGTMWVGLYGTLFSPGRSMFLYAPILIAAAAGWGALWRTRRSIAVAIASIVVPYILLHSRLPYWDGGGCWTPRYIATILPFLMISLAALVDRGLSRIGWCALALVAIASVSVQALGVSVSCIPYASRMLASEASADRMMWDVAYSPLAEHVRSAVTREFTFHVAPVFFQSTRLAWFQGASLAAGLLLLMAYLRSLFRKAPAADANWPAAPAPAVTERRNPGVGPVAASVPAAAGAVRAHGVTRAIEVSIVMPCLNEADTLETCIAKAQQALDGHQIDGEIIVADNGSTDGSQAIARRMGARVVQVEARGYGSALMGGIAASSGQYIIMGDADDSYDFLEVPRFIATLREGYDLVQGCRLPSGGGHVLPGAMPFLHRWWGNPMFSLMARRWFKAPIHDVYCGLRGFTRTLYDRLDQRCTGMEFATEMIIKSSLYHARIGEVPITLHPDGRVAHAPHLRTFRDGWRTLRFFLMYSPRWLFLAPGGLLIGLGLIGYALAMPGVTIGRLTFDAHSLLFASLGILCGYQSILFAIFTKTFAISEGLMPEDARLSRFFRAFDLEKGLALGAVSLLVGLALLVAAVNQWRLHDFGRLDYSETMRWVIPGATLTALGFQTILSTFFLSILGMRRR